MGVQGLWEILGATGTSRSLANLAHMEGFENNNSGKRAYRIGIDASIWYQHAAYSKGGENADLRLLFFRVSSLAELPILPLFVFDGRNRPKVKRGSRLGKNGSHNLTDGMKTLLDSFGMEWRMADGEAEAELAYLNCVGVIDAVMTDDVDALVFGALTVIRNPSLSLSGNKANPALNADGKASKYHVMIYTAEAIRNHSQVALTRGGMILFALLAGGDYDSGVEKFGRGIAHGLARCGFGDQLLDAFERRDRQDMQPFLSQWRAAINAELRTNSRGCLQHKHPSLSLPPTFPDMKVLRNYASPTFRRGGGIIRDTEDLSLPQIAGFCEVKFTEWGHKSAIIKRFRSLLWKAAVMRILRRAALEADQKEAEKRAAAGADDLLIRGPLLPSRVDAVGSPASLVKRYLSKADTDRIANAFVNRGPPQLHQTDHDSGDTHPLILKVVGTRRHISTDGMLEHRVEVCPTQLVALTQSGIKGVHREPPQGNLDLDNIGDIGVGSQKTTNSRKKPPPDPESTIRMWIPASIMRQVHPGLVEDFYAADEAQGAGGSTTGRKAVYDDSDVEMNGPPAKTLPKRKRKTKTKISVPELHSTSGLSADMSAHSSGRHTSFDPWFFAEDENSAPWSSQDRRGFLFFFPNPDDPAMPDDDSASAYLCGGSDLDDRIEANDLPPDRFDLLFDQIMGLATKSSKRQKTPMTRRKRSMPTVTASEGEPNEGNFNRASKRRKHMASPSFSSLDIPLDRTRTSRQPLTYQPQPFVQYSPVGGDLIGTTSGSKRWAHFRLDAKHEAIAKFHSSIVEQYWFERLVYPAAPSSQDSGLHLDVIDLT